MFKIMTVLVALTAVAAVSGCGSKSDVVVPTGMKVTPVQSEAQMAAAQAIVKARRAQRIANN